MTGRRRAVPAIVAVALSAILPDAASAQTGAIVVGGLELHAVQLSAMWASNANVGGAALDGALSAESETLRAREEARARLGAAPAVGVCESVEGARFSAGARSVEAAATWSGGDALVGWLVRDTVLTPGLTAAGDLDERFDTVVERFCAGERAIGGGRRCAGEPENHAADIHPGAVFGVRTFHDGEDALAGAEWIRNLTIPVPEEALSLRSVESEAGLRRVLARRARDARAALATGYLQGRLAARLPSVSAGPWAQAVGTQGRDEEALSRHELLGVVVRERFERPGYFARQQAEGRENLLREWIAHEAASLALSFEAYRDAERRGAMLAARLSQVLDRERRL